MLFVLCALFADLFLWVPSTGIYAWVVFLLGITGHRPGHRVRERAVRPVQDRPGDEVAVPGIHADIATGGRMGVRGGVYTMSIIGKLNAYAGLATNFFRKPVTVHETYGFTADNFRWLPRRDADLCTGCGACNERCSSGATSMKDEGDAGRSPSTACTVSSAAAAPTSARSRR